jgi:CHASE2 domain-containing sensor protein/serine phosphatase RsbU (regulator of sigma subunit)
VTPRAAWEAAARRLGPVRLAAVPVLVMLAGVIAAAPAWNSRLPAAWFDACQALSPRRIVSMPATIVEIDHKSLAALGQWPWPRFVLAQLVDVINAARPAAIGIDILMPEPDGLSPERLLARMRRQDPDLVRRLGALPGNDAELARALAEAPTVLAAAGLFEATGMPLRAPPVRVSDRVAGATGAVPASPAVPRFAGVLTSLDALDRAARGRGLVTVEPAGGVIRRLPLVASVDGTLMPALAIEMLRVAVGAQSLRLFTAGAAVEGIGVGNFVAPTEADGAVRVYYSPHNSDRFISAVDILEGRFDPAQLQQKLVLIGTTGLGLGDEKSTPLGVTMPGIEIHAQLLENLFDGTTLRRPAWAPPVEGLVFLLLGAVLVAATPRWKPRDAALLALGCTLALLASSYLAFRGQRLLFDAATPGLCLLLLFGMLLVLTLTEAYRQKRSLERVVQQQREASARIAGELDAAKRIQMATLPGTDFLRGDRRVDLAATMIPAREVGGDLYDFFRLDDRRLFLLVGDVAGKGLSASIFQAVSKALYKSTMLRAPDGEIGMLMAAANAEVSRDNPEMLFVTAFAAVLDLETGELAYCNAGHDNPYLFGAADAAVRRIADGDGPPLCAVDDFAYDGARRQLQPGEWLCIVTDGVTEAQRAAGELYGGPRVEDFLRRFCRAHAAADAGAVVAALRADVDAFAAGAEPADDLTVLVLRWDGPRGAGAAVSA